MKTRTEAKTNGESVQTLVTLGLSRDEARCYALLINNGSLKAGEIASQMDIYPNAVYRIMERLEKKGFIVSLDTHPVTFQSISPHVAIPAYIDMKEKKLEELRHVSLKSFQEEKSISSTKVDIQTGKKQMFDTYITFAKRAKKEICIISLGEPVPDEIKLANRDAIERGVKLQFISHLYTADNRELLRSWVRVGMEVRHFQGGGFHLQIFDGKTSVLTANNPKNTSERTSMVIYNEGISTVLHDYFSSVWQKAIPIKE